MTTPRLFPGGLSPDVMTAAAFGGVVVLGGINVVAVRFSSPVVPPFLGAGVRFALAGLFALPELVNRAYGQTEGGA